MQVTSAAPKSPTQGERELQLEPLGPSVTKPAEETKSAVTKLDHAEPSGSSTPFDMEKAEKEKIDLELQLEVHEGQAQKDPVRLARMRVLRKKLEVLQEEISKHAPAVQSRETYLRSTLQRQEEVETDLLRRLEDSNITDQQIDTISLELDNVQRSLVQLRKELETFNPTPVAPTPAPSSGQSGNFAMTGSGINRQERRASNELVVSPFTSLPLTLTGPSAAPDYDHLHASYAPTMRGRVYQPRPSAAEVASLTGALTPWLTSSGMHVYPRLPVPRQQSYAPVYAVPRRVRSTAQEKKAEADGYAEKRHVAGRYLKEAVLDSATRAQVEHDYGAYDYLQRKAMEEYLQILAETSYAGQAPLRDYSASDASLGPLAKGRSGPVGQPMELSAADFQVRIFLFSYDCQDPDAFLRGSGQLPASYTGVEKQGAPPPTGGEPHGRTLVDGTPSGDQKRADGRHLQRPKLERSHSGKLRRKLTTKGGGRIHPRLKAPQPLVLSLPSPLAPLAGIFFYILAN